MWADRRRKKPNPQNWQQHRSQTATRPLPPKRTIGAEISTMMQQHVSSRISDNLME
jgi:hypothetical protein